MAFLKKNYYWFLLLLFSLGFTAYAWVSYRNLHSGLFDLGLQEQVIWNTSEGRLFQSSPEVSNFLGDHFSLLFLPLALVYKILPYTLTLFVVQSLCITIGILAFYKLAKAKVKNGWMQFLILLGMLVYWPLAGALTFDFHEIVLAFPFLAWGIYYLETNFDKKKWLAFALLFVGMLAKEDVGIFVAMLGLYYFLFKKKKWGLVLLGAGFLWSALAMFVFMPYFRGNELADSLGRYAYLKLIFTDPLQCLNIFVTRAKATYLVNVFFPFLILLLLIPQTVILIGPSLAINLLSIDPAMVSGTLHYDVIISVGLFFLNILAWVKLEKLLKAKKFNEKLLKIFMIIMFGIYILMLIFHPVWNKLSKIEDRKADRQFVQDFESSLSADSSVLVSNSVGAYFAKFQGLYILDPPYLNRGLDSDYAIVDLKEYSGSRAQLLASSYRLIRWNGNIQVYEHVDIAK